MACSKALHTASLKTSERIKIEAGKQKWQHTEIEYLWDLLLLSSSLFHHYTGTGPPAADCGGSGSSNGQEKCSKAEGDAGPSCSSSSKDAGDTKSKFFEDSEESEEGEEEGSDEEVRASHHSIAFTMMRADSALWLHMRGFHPAIRMAARRRMVIAVR